MKLGVWFRMFQSNVCLIKCDQYYNKTWGRTFNSSVFITQPNAFEIFIGLNWLFWINCSHQIEINKVLGEHRLILIRQFFTALIFYRYSCDSHLLFGPCNGDCVVADSIRAKHCAMARLGAQARAGVRPPLSTMSTEAPFSNSRRVTATSP